MTERIDQRTARRIAVAASGLFRTYPRGIEGSAAILRHLGSVQLDTISVVERAHHHIFRSRALAYRPSWLESLEAEPRRAIEYWSHAAAYLPLEDFRYCLPRMERVRAQGHEWFRADPAAVAYVRERIKAEGPLMARDFEDDRGKPRGWWDWKPAKVALEYLFHAGELVSIGRRGFQKVYELAERGLPSGLDLRRPSSADCAAWYLDRAERTLGLFAADEIAYLRKDGVEGIPEELRLRLAAGKLVELRVEPSLPAESTRRGTGSVLVPTKALRLAEPPRLPPYYATPSALETALSAGADRGSGTSTEPAARILSPFDPLLIDRRRLARLFGVDYRIECYTPEAKRRFGYFPLAVLYRDARGDFGFPALLDAKAERERACLVIKRIELEEPTGKRAAGCLKTALERELRSYASFNACAETEPGLWGQSPEA